MHSIEDPQMPPEVKRIIANAVSKTPKGPEGETPLGERVPQINAALAARYQVLHKGQQLPSHYTLPANATQKDAERISGLLKDEESAQGTAAQRTQAQQNHQETMAMMQQNRQEKSDTETRKAAYEAYKPSLDAAERFNVMAKNYEDAAGPQHDQQAMLSLLYNHLGMTAGGQKGARLTRDIVTEAQNSRPWLQGMQTKFDKDGLLTGVTLTPLQMKQMVALGREKFSQELAKSRSASDFVGFKGEGPKMTPTDSVKRFYLIEAGRDPKKAQQLALADGWSE